MLHIWTVYQRPSDFPDKFVARKFNLDQPTGEVLLADTLQALRRLLPPGLYRMPRAEQDDPVIVETWM